MGNGDLGKKQMNLTKGKEKFSLMMQDLGFEH